jgi:uncharacterized repeat protein (TIGR02543 family)
MKDFMKKYGYAKAAGAVLFVPAILILVSLAGCPNPVVEADLSAAPAALVTTGVHAGEEGAEVDQKAVVFTLTSSHPVDAAWKVYTEETGGEALSTVSASYDPATKKLTLTARENDLVPDGVYWVSVTERGRDESSRLELTVKFLYPIKISYDANGGAFGDESVLAEEIRDDPGDPVPFPGTTPTRAGFAFAGWNEKSDGSGGVFTKDTVLTGDLYVFARWIAENTEYILSFDANGGAFSAGASTLDIQGTFSAGSGTSLGAAAMPEEPTHPVYSFDSWNTRPDGLGTVFDKDTLINDLAITVYAKWKWDKDLAPSLRLHHDFDPLRYGGGVFTPQEGAAVPDTGAAPKGSTWTRGSGSYGGKTFHYFKTGAKGAMNNANTSYLNLGTGAGTIIKAAGSAYTIAVYVRIDGDWSGNGNFIWAFAETNNTQQNSGQALWLSAPGSSHATTTGGWGSAARNISIANAADKITRSTWHHVAYTQDGNTGTDNAKLYVDGVLKVTGTIPYLPALNFASSLVFNTLGGPCFASDNNLSQTMFTGLRIYDEALEGIQVAALAEDLNDLKAVASWEENTTPDTLTPASAMPIVIKTSLDQQSAVFTLTADTTGTWKVYNALTGGGEISTVSVTFDAGAKALTLTGPAGGIPAGVYYVSLTESGKGESARLALKVRDPLPDLIFNLDFGATEGNTTAAKGTATLRGAIEYEDGVKGKAAKFTARNAANYLEASDDTGDSLLAGLPEFSVAFWLKQADGSPNWWFYAAPNANAQAYPREYYVSISYGNNNKLETSRWLNGRNNGTGNGATSADNSITEGTWQHVVVVHGLSSAQIYIDGQLSGTPLTDSGIKSITGILQVSPITLIGRANWGSGEGSVGSIDEYKIYSKPLTAQEAADLYNAEKPAP